MSLASVHVRARDGAFYKNPLFVFEEGFFCFDYTDRPEAVLWQDGSALCNVLDVLGRVLGRAVDLDTLTVNGRSLRVVPDTEPWEFRPAASFFVDVVARIPRPTAHEGTERYPRNCSGLIMDWGAHPLDAYELEVPK